MWRDTTRLANRGGSAGWNLNEMDGSESMAICVNLRKLTFVPEGRNEGSQA